MKQKKLKNIVRIATILTHYGSVLLSCTPVKYQKTYRFPDVFRKSNTELKWVKDFLLSDHSNMKEHSEVALYLCSTKNIHRKTIVIKNLSEYNCLTGPINFTKFLRIDLATSGYFWK